jgi:predicted small metal-binding protein
LSVMPKPDATLMPTIFDHLRAQHELQY